MSRIVERAYVGSWKHASLIIQCPFPPVIVITFRHWKLIPILFQNKHIITQRNKKFLPF